MHDVPYVPAKEISPEIVSMMTRICTSVRQLIPEYIPCGLQVCYKLYLNYNTHKLHYFNSIFQFRY